MRVRSNSPSIDTEKSGTKVDLSDVFELLRVCFDLLRQTSSPSALSMMLKELIEEAENRFPIAPSSRPMDLDRLLDREMRSRVSNELQGGLRRLVALISAKLKRDSADDKIYWLNQSIRDFDVFQASAFAALCLAYGYTPGEITNSDGVASGRAVTILDTNRSAGLSQFRKIVSGWRDASIQPSDYRPDAVVIVDGMPPVLVDAKYSLSSSVDYPIPPNSLKEVQAYLDEFDLPGILVVLPRILENPLLSYVETPVLEGTDLRGFRRVIVAIELQDSCATGTHQKIRYAVGEVHAAYADR